MSLLLIPIPIFIGDKIDFSMSDSRALAGMPLDDEGREAHNKFNP